MFAIRYVRFICVCSDKRLHSNIISVMSTCQVFTPVEKAGMELEGSQLSHTHTHTHTTCDFLAVVTPSLSVYCLSSLCLKISETFYANCNKGDGKVPILNPCRPNWLYHMAHDVWEAIIGPNTQRGGVLTPEPSGCPLTKRPNMLAWSSSKPTHATILSLYQCYL